MADASSLIVDLKPGEVLRTSSGVCIKLVHKSGQLARLQVLAPREVKIEKSVIPVPSMAR